MANDTEIAAGKSIDIVFEAKRCIHSRSCVLGRPDVFVPNVQGEWLHPDAATTDEVVGLALGCPSGAIRFNRHDGGPQESPPLVNLVRVRENGPLAVHAELKIDGAPAGMRATLCRCGASSRKPYCDGSHASAGFLASGEPATAASEALAARAGALTVTPLKDGPLLVQGNLEIVSGTGRTINRVEKTALCRCGHSSNKPYCDGTHAKTGFKSE